MVVAINAPLPSPSMMTARGSKQQSDAANAPTRLTSAGCRSLRCIVPSSLLTPHNPTCANSAKISFTLVRTLGGQLRKKEEIRIQHIQTGQDEQEATDDLEDFLVVLEHSKTLQPAHCDGSEENRHSTA